MICKKCKDVKEVDDFYNSNKSTCKDCLRAKARKYDRTTRSKGTDRKRSRRQKHYNELMEYIGGQKCSICGFIDEYRGCFDFHHIDESKKEFGIAGRLDSSIAVLKKEADKCILVCANCHRKLHRKEGEI